MHRSPTAAHTTRSALAAGLLALAGLAACGDAARPPTGVLLISIDSLRADHLSSYGYRSPTRPELATSPQIDRRIAARGTLFEFAVSTTSWTLPAHMALLTGKPNAMHGVRDFNQRLHGDHALLAELFLAQGWRTAGFWSGPNLSPEFGFGRGFERYVDCSAVDRDGSFSLGTDDASVEELRELHNQSHSTQTSPLVQAAFEEWLGELGQDERFFAFAHLWDVHYDWTPPDDFDLFDPDYSGPVHSGIYSALPEMLTRRPPDRDLDRLRSLYDGELLYTDHYLGRMLDALEASGRLDDTLIVLTADHGEAFLEHRSIGHKHSLYEEEVRVPLILAYPGRVPAGRRVPDLVSLVDVLPTVLELCALETPSDTWGRSLTPCFEGSLPPRPAPLALYSSRAALDQRGLHAGDHKVIRTSPEEAPKVFVLARDPGETEALVRPEQDARVQAAEEFWGLLDAQSAGLARATEGAPSDELRARLGDAGYLDPQEDEEDEQ